MGIQAHMRALFQAKIQYIRKKMRDLPVPGQRMYGYIGGWIQPAASFYVGISGLFPGYAGKDSMDAGAGFHGIQAVCVHLSGNGAVFRITAAPLGGVSVSRHEGTGTGKDLTEPGQVCCFSGTDKNVHKSSPKM
jgi:hypothetical protein